MPPERLIWYKYLFLVLCGSLGVLLKRTSLSRLRIFKVNNVIYFYGATVVREAISNFIRLLDAELLSDNYRSRNLNGNGTGQVETFFYRYI